jgi:hypothetical protein
VNPVTILTAAVAGNGSTIAGLGANLGDVAAIGLGVGVSIFALTKGWHLLKRFVN